MKSLTTLAVAVTLVFLRMDLAAQQASKSQAQEAPASNQTEAANSKLTVHSNLVFLPTRVQKKNGETIYGLKPEQFIIEDNGVPQTVHIEEDPDAVGLSLAVVVQCSGSAPSEFDKLKTLDTMIQGIVGDGPHEVAVMSYGEAPYLLSYFSSRPEAVQSALSKLMPCGSVAQATTIDAVYYAIGMLKRRENHYRRAILLISEPRPREPLQARGRRGRTWRYRYSDLLSDIFPGEGQPHRNASPPLRQASACTRIQAMAYSFILAATRSRASTFSFT